MQRLPCCMLPWCMLHVACCLGLHVASLFHVACFACCMLPVAWCLSCTLHAVCCVFRGALLCCLRHAAWRTLRAVCCIPSALRAARCILIALRHGHLHAAVGVPSPCRVHGGSLHVEHLVLCVAWRRNAACLLLRVSCCVSLAACCLLRVAFRLLHLARCRRMAYVACCTLRAVVACS